LVIVVRARRGNDPKNLPRVAERDAEDVTGDVELAVSVLADAEHPQRHGAARKHVELADRAEAVPLLAVPAVAGVAVVGIEHQQASVVVRTGRERGYG
jgi:hypothetical protein